MMNDGWILVSERLPGRYDRVLTTIQVLGGEPKVRSGFFHDGLFSNDNGDVWKYTDKEVIAWRPLPEPYEREGEMRVGDEATISGVIVDTDNDNILVMLPNGDEIWIDAENVKTVRPNGKGGRG